MGESTQRRPGGHATAMSLSLYVILEGIDLSYSFSYAQRAGA